MANHLFLLKKTIDKFKEDNTSQYFYPGNIIILYKNIKTFKSKERITCDLCSEVIYPNTYYEAYRPLIYNLTTGKSYYLKKTIKSKLDCQHYLPSNIRELEIMQTNVDNAYDISFKDQESIFPNQLSMNKVDYEEFSNNTGGFYLEELNKNKKKYQYINKIKKTSSL
jgi:hypothetical protein